MRVGRMLMISCLLATVAVATEPAPEPGEKLAALGWLTGTWIGPSGRGTWEARYTTADAGMLLSVNKETVNGKAVSFELERFSVEGSDIVLHPYVKGVKSPATFKMTEFDVAARRAVFENPEHDFPQIITYHRTSDTTLNIKVQARRNGELRGFELNLERQ